jgi:hypothetical protein
MKKSLRLLAILQRELMKAGLTWAEVARRFFARSQVLLYGVARQACTPGYLADGHLVAHRRVTAVGIEAFP